MSPRLPAIAYVLGVAGVLPFIACGVAAVSPGEAASLGLPALLAYGALILSFVGAVHWGFALAAPRSAASALRPSITVRLALAIVPSLIGWTSVILGLLQLSELGLALLTAGFIATVGVEARWAKAGLVPDGYMILRWILSVLVVMTLGTALALRLLGATIAF